MLDYKIECREIRYRRRNGPEMIGLDLPALARAWIDDCIHNHALCPNPDAYRLPTRVLDVGEASTLLNTVRLHVSADGEEGRWTALSYCWGGTQHVYKTTAANLGDVLAGIQISKLPRTIRDAISVTRGLGIRYLWVDALCIIQDSEEDWQGEAANMMNVYRDAYVVIAANSGVDAESGLGIDRNILESRPYEMKFRTPGGSSCTRFRWIHPPRQPWSRMVKQGALQRRGWTLQETMLPVRLILYDEMGIFWQCREGIRQERVAAHLITALDPTVPRRLFDSYNDDPMNIFTLWGEMIEAFTQRSLTFESDKLLAVAGMANAVATYIRGRSARRLATEEEKAQYRVPPVPSYWAVPENPKATKWQRYDGANASLRAILFKEELETGKARLTYTRGPLSMDPFLVMRLFRGAAGGDFDSEADEAFQRPTARTMEIMRSVGLGPFLEFRENEDNPDYDDEFVNIMSHPDTHAAFQRAYRLWKAEKNGESIVLAREPGPGEHSQQNVAHHQIGAPNDEAAACSRRQPEGAAASDEGSLDAALAGQGPLPEGIVLVGTLYVYDDKNASVRARVEGTRFTLDDEYLAGLWKADLFYQLRWFCKKQGRRPAAYRAPSWSWASLDTAKIAFDKFQQSAYSRLEESGLSVNWHPRLLDVRVVVPAGRSRLGNAVSAKLTMLAHVRSMPFYHDVDADLTEPKGNASVKSDRDWAEGNEGIYSKCEHTGELPSPGWQHLSLDIVGTRLDPHFVVLRLDDLSCLILEPAETSIKEPAVFRRAGYWVCNDKQTFTTSLDGWETKVVSLI